MISLIGMPFEIGSRSASRKQTRQLASSDSLLVLPSCYIVFKRALSMAPNEFCQFLSWRDAYFFSARLNVYLKCKT